jgi:hypothetical protein
MTKTTDRFLEANKAEIDAFVRSIEVQKHINAIYAALNEEIVSAFPQLADTGNGSYDAREPKRLAIKALIFKQYFKNWVNK